MPDTSVLPSQHCPCVIDVLAAITATMAGDSHDGVGMDYERMETLGDSVLKFISSTYLYFRYPEFFEGQLSLSKHYLVSNHNLWFRGLTGLHLGDYIRAVPFMFAAIPLPGSGLPASSWIPQCVAVRGKVMGDVMEALLGGAYVRGGIWGALAVAVHLHLLPPRAYELMSAYQHQPHVRVGGGQCMHGAVVVCRSVVGRTWHLVDVVDVEDMWVCVSGVRQCISAADHARRR